MWHFLATPSKILKVLKVEHDKFTWTGRKYHMSVGMVDTNDKDIWLRDLDAQEVFPLSTEFLGFAGYQANT